MDIFGRDTQKFVGKVIDNADVLIIYTDPKENISICNKKFEAMAAKKREQIIGNNVLDLLYPNDSSSGKQQMFKAVIDNAIAYKRANSFEDLIADSNNSERFISWSITPILSESQDIEGILLIGNDITEVKEREASVKKIDETLHNIFSSIKEYALYLINLDGNITYYGMGSEMMFGWQKNEIVFKHVSLLHTPDDATAKLPLILEQVKRAGQHEIEIDLVKKDGQPFPVILTVSQFLDVEGKLSGYVFIAKDITERKKLEYQILQAEKLAAIGQLVASMAHEISNPLFVISGRLEILLEEGKLDHNTREVLGIVNTQSDRIRKLVDRLLKFARKTPPALEKININDIIESALPLVSYHKLPTVNIEMEKDLAEGLPVVKGDLNQLQEVFVNLFLNAYQAMPQGGKLSIKTSNFQNLYAQIKISDTGCGISPQNLKNIFMPFFSTKKDGTGLGLSVCYNIIRNHNGYIDIESQVNRGTTFTIKLPFA